jgi:hypothetical protein
MTEFKKELTLLLNRFSMENKSSTPDFILARYLTQCIDTFNDVVVQRDHWHGYNTRIKASSDSVSPQNASAAEPSSPSAATDDPARGTSCSPHSD